MRFFGPLFLLSLPVIAYADLIPPQRMAQKIQAQAPKMDEETARVLDGIQKFYAEAKDFSAEFEQTYTYIAHQRSQISKGKVYFKKPGKMRWDYQTPSQKVFVSDGSLLWVYEPEENQAFKRPIKSVQLPVALSFLSGEGNLAEEFDAVLKKPRTEGTYLVELIPKRDQGDYRALRLEVDATTYAVQKSTVVDPVGNTNHIAFSAVKTNSGLPDAGFSFTPPAGVRVLQDQ